MPSSTTRPIPHSYRSILKGLNKNRKLKDYNAPPRQRLREIFKDSNNSFDEKLAKDCAEYFDAVNQFRYIQDWYRIGIPENLRNRVSTVARYVGLNTQKLYDEEVQKYGISITQEEQQELEYLEGLRQEFKEKLDKERKEFEDSLPKDENGNPVYGFQHDDLESAVLAEKERIKVQDGINLDKEQNLMPEASKQTTEKQENEQNIESSSEANNPESYFKPNFSFSSTKDKNIVPPPESNAGDTIKQMLNDMKTSGSFEDTLNFKDKDNKSKK